MSTRIYTGRRTNWTSVVISGVLLVVLVAAATTSGSTPDALLWMVALARVGLQANRPDLGSRDADRTSPSA